MHSQWTDWFASIVGLRYDHFDVDVKGKAIDANPPEDLATVSPSGEADDAVVSPKLSLHFGPFEKTNFFANYGKGFHSNDARGVIKGDVPLISESEGFEFGLQNSSIENLQFSAVLFHLALDSELVFVGADGTTEAKDASERKGIELSMYYQPVHWLILDADYTKSEAKFKQTQVEVDEKTGVVTILGDYVPDSIEDVFSMGMSLESQMGVYGGLRMRYFGPRNLNEAGDIKSDSSSTFNANVGYQMNSGISLGLEILNVFDSQDDDITYWYESQPQGETAQEDFHSHPMIPRTVRASVGYEF